MASSRMLAARIGAFVAMAVLGGGCDLRTKDWAEEHLSGLPAMTMRVAEPWLDFALSYNQGTAFSVITDLGTARWLFGALALAAVIGLFVYALRQKSGWIELSAAALIAGGAIGNGVDRLFREAPGGGTGVVDFIRVNYPWGGSWPTFNVADVLVAVGVGLLLIGDPIRRRARRGAPA